MLFCSVTPSSKSDDRRQMRPQLAAAAQDHMTSVSKTPTEPEPEDQSPEYDARSPTPLRDERDSTPTRDERPASRAMSIPQSMSPISSPEPTPERRTSR